MIDEEYIKLSYQERNNIEHKITFFNKTKNIDITDFVENETLNINKFITNESNSISPNSVSLELKFPDFEDIDEKTIVYFDESDKYFNELEGYFDENISEKLKNVVEKDDEVIIYDTFNNTKLELFTGIVKNPLIRQEHLYKILIVEIKDKTVLGYYKRFEKDEVYQGHYFYNSSDKEHSLLYNLAKRIGFEEDKIEIEEIKYSIGDYIRVPVAKFEKDKKIMEELAELVKAVVGSVYVTGNGTLKITSLINQKDSRELDYELKKGNVLSYLEEWIDEKEDNKVEVTFAENKTEPRQAVFILAGQNMDYEKDDAKIKVPANTTENDTYWKIEYMTEYVNNLETIPEVVAYKANSDGTKTYVNYTEYDVELTNTEGKVKFLNTSETDIFIEKFKIYGEPIKLYENNTVSYTEKVLEDHEVELYTYENKYVQELRHAQEVAKYLYYINCREQKHYKLIVNAAPFLELEDVVNLKFEDSDKKIQLINISQSGNQTEIEAVDFKIYQPAAEHFETEKSNLYDKDYLNNGYVEYGNIKYPTDKPPAPIGVTPEHQFLGFGIRWQALERTDIKEYVVYVKSLGSNGLPDGKLNTKFGCGNATYKIVSAEPGSYEVKIAAISQAGIEGELSSAVIANSIKVDGTALNVDDESIVVDTSNHSLVLGKVYAKNITSNSILSNMIAANQIDATHVKANTITTDKILFGAGDAIQKGSGGGIVIKTLDGNNLSVVGMTNIYGTSGLTVYNNLSDESSTHKTVIQGGQIIFYEKSP